MTLIVQRVAVLCCFCCFLTVLAFPPQSSTTTSNTSITTSSSSPPSNTCLTIHHEPTPTPVTMAKAWDEEKHIDLLLAFHMAVKGEKSPKELQQRIVEAMKAKGHDDANWDMIRYSSSLFCCFFLHSPPHLAFLHRDHLCHLLSVSTKIELVITSPSLCLYGTTKHSLIS